LFLFSKSKLKKLQIVNYASEQIGQHLQGINQDMDMVLIVIDASIKNNVAILIAKITHDTTNINFTKVELFTIRYRINHAIYLPNVNCIIIITDAIPVAR